MSINSLFPNIASDNEYFLEGNDENNDELVKRYKNNIGVQRYCFLNDIHSVFKTEKIGVSVSIEDYFEEGFFYKGPKWNKYYEYMYHKDITILTSIQVKEGLFYLEIENVTYPYYGYILFDLNEFHIIEAKKI